MFLLFRGINYYPAGGAKDYVNAYSTADGAILDGQAYLREQGSLAWFNVFDVKRRVMVHHEEVEANGDVTVQGEP